MATVDGDRQVGTVSVRVLVLGPLEVVDGRESIEIGGTRLRRLLAGLASRPGQVMPTDRLMDIVWHGELPDHPETTFRTYVHRLRRALDEDGLIRFEPPGYVLSLPSDRIDATRFESLGTDARSHLDRGEHEQAAELLQQALALWRGAAFIEFAEEDWAQPHAVRLEQAKAVATEDLVEARMALGQHADVIATLDDLIAEHPLRDRPRKQLMLALYRSGRQPEALRAFRAYRDLLGDELGLEPSPDLRSLEQQIVTRDPGLQPAMPVGRSLRGYRLGEKLGQGMYGAVYRAVQPVVDREVAIKVIRPELANDPDYIRRFDVEAQIVARLEHPHVVPLYDYWREPDGAYLVMRLMRGGNLDDHAGEGKWDLGRVAKLTDQIGDALSAADRDGIVHGDVRPSNILLDEDDNAYLSDFGIATDVTADLPPTAASSPGYQSPETSCGGLVGAASDVYSLAAICYRLLTGSQPCPDARGRCPRLALVRPDVPPAVDRLLADAMSPAVADRPADGGAFRVRFAAAVEGKPIPDSRAGAAPASPPVNPYKGLRPFVEADAPDFFGRDRVVDELLVRLADGDRLIALVGPSGCGKSSVVRAGVLPELRLGHVSGSERWFIATMTPGAHPYEELEAALLRVAVQPPALIAEVLGDDERGLARAAGRILPDEDSELLLVIDQFEELFTMTSPTDRRRFLDLLSASIVEGERRLRLVITLRADFYDRPLSSSRLGRAIGAATAPIAALSPEELDHAIVGPAARVGVDVEPGLVTEIVADLADRSAALPLLQYTLTELFDHRADRTLTSDSYRRIGGVAGTMARRADEVYEALGSDDRWVAQQLFTRLVTIGEAGHVTGRRTQRTELTNLVEPGTSMDEVIDGFVAARLLTLDRDPSSRNPTVEIAHEALLAEWTTLRCWVDDRREQLVQRRHLEATMEEWVNSGRDPDYLLAGARLEQFEGLAADAAMALTTSERDFLAQSRDRQDRHAASRRRRRGAVIGMVVAAALIAMVLAAIAVVQRNRADDEAQRRGDEALVNRARELAAGSLASVGQDPELAALLALEAVEATRSHDGTVLREAEEALHEAAGELRLVAVLPGFGRAAFAPTGEVLTGGEEAVLWNPDTGEQQLTLPAPDPSTLWTAVAVSPDADRFATGGSNGDVAVWDSSGQQLWDADGAHGTDIVFHATFSPDGELLATAGGDGDAIIWDTQTGDRRGTLSASHPQAVFFSIDFSPDATHLAGAGPFNPDAMIGDVASGEWIVELAGHAFEPFAVRYFPAGDRVVTSAADSALRLWDAETGEMEAVAFTDSGLNYGLAVAPDGRLVASGGDRGVVDVWEATPDGLRHVDSLVGHDAPIDWLEFSADGSRLASVAGSDSGSPQVRIWDATATGSREHLTVGNAAGAASFDADGARLAVGVNPDRIVVYDTASGEMLGEIGAAFDADSLEFLEGVAFSPDGRLLVVSTWDGSYDGAVRLWDVRTGEMRHTLADGTPSRGNVAFTTDGALVAAATCYDDGSKAAQIWDVETGAEVFAAPSGCGYGIALSPDDRLLAVSTPAELDNVAVWDLATSELVAAFTIDTGFKGPLEFSADGALLLAGGGPPPAKVWAVGTGEEVLSLELGAVTAFDVAFSPDGSRIATALSDGTVRMWDASTGEETLRLQIADAGELRDLDFSADGKRLVVSPGDGPTRVLALDIDDLTRLTRDRLTRDFTEQECRTFNFDVCP